MAEVQGEEELDPVGKVGSGSKSTIASPDVWFYVCRLIACRGLFWGIVGSSDLRVDAGLCVVMKSFTVAV